MTHTDPSQDGETSLTTAQIANAGEPAEARLASAGEPAEAHPANTGDPAEARPASAGDPAEPRPSGIGDRTAEPYAADANGRSAEPRPSGTSSERPIPADDAHSTSTAEPGSALISQRPQTPLLEPDDLESIVNRWRDIQAGFVDEPRRAVKDADALVADLMQRLARVFAAEREELESRWMAGTEVSTEDLRQGLRRYRSFFERLLAA